MTNIYNKEAINNRALYWKNPILKTLLKKYLIKNEQFNNLNPIKKNKPIKSAQKDLAVIVRRTDPNGQSHLLRIWSSLLGKRSLK